jgi:hypothetical protein
MGPRYKTPPMQIASSPKLEKALLREHILTVTIIRSDLNLQTASTFGRTLSTGAAGAVNLAIIRPRSDFPFPRLDSLGPGAARRFKAGNT